MIPAPIETSSIGDTIKRRTHGVCVTDLMVRILRVSRAKALALLETRIPGRKAWAVVDSASPKQAPKKKHLGFGRGSRNHSLSARDYCMVVAESVIPRRSRECLGEGLDSSLSKVELHSAARIAAFSIADPYRVMGPDSSVSGHGHKTALCVWPSPEADLVCCRKHDHMSERSALDKSPRA
jgi:hypothetical protein